jgi:hypothetical protein
MTIAFALSPITQGIATLYKFTGEIGASIDSLLSTMQKSANRTIAQAGKVIDAARYGFGIGYVTPIIIIAVGQLILGNPLAAATTVITSSVNPVAMTCAALGAIYFGWRALDDGERNAIIERLRAAFEIGAELVKAIISFVLAKAKDLWGSELIADVKLFVSDAAHIFGRSLVDVTDSFKDRAAVPYRFVLDKLKRDSSDELPKLPRLPI